MVDATLLLYNLLFDAGWNMKNSDTSTRLHVTLFSVVVYPTGRHLFIF